MWAVVMVELSVHVNPTIEMLDGFVKRMGNVKPAMQSFYTYMRQQTDMTFQMAGPGPYGGSYRGVTWAGFANQYTRTDGTVIPAWGGVPRVVRHRVGKAAPYQGPMTRKLRHGGKVKGSMRPSGKRVTAASMIGRDTGRMAAQAGSKHRISGGKIMKLRMYVNVNYGRRFQEGDPTTNLPPRPFLFFQNPQDLHKFRDMVHDYIMGTNTARLNAVRITQILNAKQQYLRTYGV
jgi:phage gpG-like protein